MKNPAHDSSLAWPVSLWLYCCDLKMGPGDGPGHRLDLIHLNPGRTFLGNHSMLEIRPNCELCDRDLPAISWEARICSYECTFCADCVENILNNVCPNCGGGFENRPIRPRTARRDGVSLAHQPASDKRVHARYNEQEIVGFSGPISPVSPEQR